MAFSLDKRTELELREMPGNNICCDCDGKNPQWASISFGVFMCLECSGRHRGLGVHISFVRSVSMDSWNDKQIQKMRLGGNDACIQFLQKYGVPKNMPIAQKYNTPAAALYRDRLDAQANGRPLPTELPAAQGSAKGGMSGAGSTHSSAGSLSSSSGVQQGTDPLPGESEAAYVARQRLLQEEARERMRQKFGASNGLRSGGGGGMQGIGSDPSYRPGEGGSGRGGGAPDINEIGANAFSFVSSWADTITKTTQQLVQEATSNKNSGGTNNSSANSSSHGGSAGGEGNGQAADPWAAITTGAVGFWKQATEVTSDLVSIITKPEDEAEFKFPRPPTWEEKNSNSSNAGSSAGGSGRNSAVPPAHQRSSSYGAASGGNSGIAAQGSGANERHSVGSSESWDNLEDMDQEETPAPLSGSNGSGGSQRRSSPAGEHSPYAHDSSPGIAASERHHLGSGSSSGRQQPGALSLHPPAPAASTAPNMRRNTSTSSTNSANGGNNSARAAATPTGDDFFANFGI